MSIYSVGNSAAPSIIGYGGLGLSVLSGLSLLAGGPAILNIPGGPVVDFAFAAAAFLTAGAILKSRDPVAGWLGAALLTVMVVYAGLVVNISQATNMLDAAKNAATHGARAASNSVLVHSNSRQPQQQQWATLGNSKKWTAIRELSAQEVTACGKTPAPEWRNKPQGIRNCTKQQNGKYYIWRWQ